MTTPRLSTFSVTFAFLALVASLSIVALLLLATPPTGSGPTSTAPIQSGAPHASGTTPIVGMSVVPSPLAMTLRHPRHDLVDRVASLSERSSERNRDLPPDDFQVMASGDLPDTSTAVRGQASWYCGGGSSCTRGYPPGTLAAAAGPALRVGDWRGRIVKVTANGRSVRVALVDWCACPRRVIDLYRSAFSRLASPSRGVLNVTISWGGRTSALPPTDTR